MRIKKILNNNVIIGIDSHGQECVVTGRGIAFEKKPGDEINKTIIDKVFSPREKGVVEKLSRIVEAIPLDHVRVCDEIINMAKSQLSGKLNEKIYLTLIDHISFAIERHQEGVNLKSSLKWEMKQFYPDEFRTGQLALDIIEKRLNLCLPVDEAAFIAFHLVNASGAVNDNMQESLELISSVLGIVKRYFNIEFNEESLSYNRFLTHLKYFSHRVFSVDDSLAKNNTDSGLSYELWLKLPGETSCVDEIAAYVYQKYHHKVSDDDKTYLLLHLHNMMTR